jgi:hypothetical protein
VRLRILSRKCFNSILLCALLSANAWAQEAPKIGLVEIFGLNKVKDSTIRTSLGAKEGDELPTSKGNTEERINQISGVVESHLEAVCCDAMNRVILYVGIEERGAPHFDLREPPEADAELPASVVSLYRELLQAIEDASRRGSTAEDLTKGHSLMADPLAREIQIKLPDIAQDQMATLRRVLRTAEGDEQRAMAAYILGYAPRKRDVIDDLQFALRDSEPSVRANAVQALLAISVYASLNPDQTIRVQPTWFVEMLNSLSWSDRDHALKALQVLTDKRDPVAIDLLRERALNSLIEMSRWKTLPHALPAFVLLGRVAGWSEAQIQDAWTKGDRESVITAATRKTKR